MNRIEEGLRRGLRPAHVSLLPLLVLSLIVLAALLALDDVRESRRVSPPWSIGSDAGSGLAQEASREQVDRTCATCHPYPPPELFPKLGWPHEVDRGFRFLREGAVPAQTPSFASVVAYYQALPRALSYCRCSSGRSRPTKALCGFSEPAIGRRES